MSRRLRWIFVAALAALASMASSTQAYVRLRPCGTAVAWDSSAWPLAFTICNKDTAGADVSNASKTSIRLAFAAWDGLAGTGVAFSENTSLASKTFDNIDEDSSHLLVFDDDNSYFSSGSGAVAVTLVEIDNGVSGCPTSGQITDADIVINSSNFTLSTGAIGVGGTVDLQNVLAHEIGHFIGLDHQPVPSATMTALTTFAEISKRSLSQDDISGAVELRPSGTSYGTVSGTIHRPSSVAAAFPYVVALDSNGNVVAGNLGNSSGVFSFYCPAGSGVTVYATPYRGTMGSEVTQPGTASSDFSMTFYGNNDSPTSSTVTGGADLALGTLTSNAILGSTGTFFAYPFSAAQVNRGASSAVSINKGTGSESLSGLTLELSNPSSADLTASSVTVGANSVSFSATAGSSAALGARDLRLVDASATPDKKTVSIGAIEIVTAAPTISSLDVTSGSGDGGTAVTITGTGFQGSTSTLKVLFGDTQGTVTGVSSTTVNCTSPAHAAGAVTVGVINPDGQGANASTQFTFNVSLTSVTPSSVCHTGQRTITLSGSGFVDGMTVAVNGTACTNVSVSSDSSLTAKLPVLDPGTYSIVVTKPDTSTATLLFGIVFSTSCGGGGGGGCFGVVASGPLPPAEHLGLLFPFLVLFAALAWFARRQGRAPAR